MTAPFLEERVSKLSTELNNANDLLEVSRKKGMFFLSFKL